MLDTGLNNYQIDLSQGPAPLYFVFAMSTLDRLAGEQSTCMTKFEQCGLQSFDLIKDQDSVTGFPLTGEGLASGSFYNNFLRQTNRFIRGSLVIFCIILFLRVSNKVARVSKIK